MNNYQEMMDKMKEKYGDSIQITPVDKSGFTDDMMMAFTKGVDLNNDAYQAANRGDYATAIEKYNKALDIKLKAYGEDSHHVCISLSGLADAYLSMGDKANAMKEAKRMLVIARKLNNAEQIRIAREIITDVLKEN